LHPAILRPCRCSTDTGAWPLSGGGQYGPDRPGPTPGRHRFPRVNPVPAGHGTVVLPPAEPPATVRCPGRDDRVPPAAPESVHADPRRSLARANPAPPEARPARPPAGPAPGYGLCPPYGPVERAAPNRSTPCRHP